MNEKLLKELNEWASVELSGTEQKEMNEILSRYPTTENKGREVIDGAIRVIRDRINELESLPVTKEQQDFAAALGVALSALNDYRPASPTKADKVESLAELADRKGMYIILSKNCAYPVGWLIHLQYKITPFDKFSMYEIPGKDDDNVYTYALAEAKARAFLTGLDDVTGKGGR